MKDILSAFWRDETGPELVEWAAVVSLLLVASVVFLIVTRNTMIDVIRDVFVQMRKAPPQDF